MVQARLWAFTSLTDRIHRRVFRDHAWYPTRHIIVQGPDHPWGKFLDSYETENGKWEWVGRAVLAWFGDCWEYVCALLK